MQSWELAGNEDYVLQSTSIELIYIMKEKGMEIVSKKLKQWVFISWYKLWLVVNIFTGYLQLYIWTASS
jgi:hypothetical protein